jgi:hypothetical protein
MNSFNLGKLAEIHNQNLLESADKIRRARSAAPRRLAPPRKYQFRWSTKSMKRPFPAEAMAK